MIPNSFMLQLYNPDQQIVVKQKQGSWGSSGYWEFELPQQTFRQPSTSTLDRSQNDPAANDTTPKVCFKWKKDSKLSKDLTCQLSGKSSEAGKKSKEPDITVAFSKHNGKEITIYEPNLYRAEVEDAKGLEVVILLSAIAIKDLYFNSTGPQVNELFNITPSQTKRTNTGAILGTTLNTSPSTSPQLPSRLDIPANSVPTQSNQHHPLHSTKNRSKQPQPPPADPRTQWEIEAETARLRAQYEAEKKEYERKQRAEQKKTAKALEAEEKERRKREAEVAKETERLKKLYGIEGQLLPSQQRHQHQRQPNSSGPYLQPMTFGRNGHSHGQSASMSGFFGGPSDGHLASTRRRKSIFGLRSLSDESQLNGGQKLAKKKSTFF
jgi:hypothetical protein